MIGRRLARLCALGAIAAAIVALEVPLCPTATLLGLPCPGCGLGRATLALLRGDVAGSLALHPLAPLVVVVFVALGGWVGAGYVARGSLALPSWVGWPLGALLAALVTVWIARFALGAFGGPVAV